MTRRVALALALWCALAAPAHAAGVSSAELRSLAARAQRGDGGARERLNGVDRVDGRPVDIGAALQGAEGDELGRRLRQLTVEAGGDGGAPDASAARGTAGDVLDERRFTGTDVPRPFRGAFGWLGDRIEPVVGAIEDALRAIPGPAWAAWLLLLALFGTAAAWLGVRASQRRAARGADETVAGRAARREDAAGLEREAVAAEAAGDFERAVRLRFRAGLLRLDERAVIAWRPSLTTHEVAETLRSDRFDALGASFERVAYGGELAGRPQVDEQRAGWPAVLDEVGKRAP